MPQRDEHKRTCCTFALTFIHQRVSTRLNSLKQSSVLQGQTTTSSEVAVFPCCRLSVTGATLSSFYFYHLLSSSKVKCLHPPGRNMSITAVFSSSDFYNSCFLCWNEWNTCWLVIKTHPWAKFPFQFKHSQKPFHEAYWDLMKLWTQFNKLCALLNKPNITGIWYIA